MIKVSINSILTVLLLLSSRFSCLLQRLECPAPYLHPSLGDYLHWLDQRVQIILAV